MAKNDPDSKEVQEIKNSMHKKYSQFKNFVLAGGISNYFQNPAAEMFNSMIELHNDVMFILMWLTLFIFWFINILCMVYSEINFEKFWGWTSKINHNNVLEILWTSIPIAILVSIAIPSLALLYASNEPHDIPRITVKITGNQWYWHYKYSVMLEWLYNPNSFTTLDFDHIGQINMINNLSFDSYMKLDADLDLENDFRLLSVDHPLVLPVKTCIRLLITAEDVIHSRAVPAFGIKTDAIPGRLNQTWLYIHNPGIYYGQCSELCGVNHAFMPICVRAVALSEFCDSSLSMMILKHNPEFAKELVSDGRMSPTGRFLSIKQNSLIYSEFELDSAKVLF